MGAVLGIVGSLWVFQEPLGVASCVVKYDVNDAKQAILIFQVVNLDLEGAYPVFTVHLGDVLASMFTFEIIVID